MSILDDENIVFKDIAEKASKIQQEKDHYGDYSQAWYDVIKFAIDHFDRPILANILFTYQENYWNVILKGYGNANYYYVIFGENPVINKSFFRPKALKNYIAELSGSHSKELDNCLFDWQSKNSILQNLFGINGIKDSLELYEIGIFRKNYNLGSEKVISKYEYYLDKIKFLLARRNIFI